MGFFYFYKMKQASAYISNGKRPLWHTLIAALFFTFSIGIGYALFFDVSFLPSNRDYGTLFYAGTFSIMMGIRYAEVIDYEFDFENRIYKKIRTFGFVKIPSSQSFSNLKYVAVFNNENTGAFEVNLWHGKNKRFSITFFYNDADALEAASTIAGKLSLNLWDATNPRQGKWVV